jgi:hypothetical protein
MEWNEGREGSMERSAPTEKKKKNSDRPPKWLSGGAYRQPTLKGLGGFGVFGIFDTPRTRKELAGFGCLKREEK